MDDISPKKDIHRAETQLRTPVPQSPPLGGISFHDSAPASEPGAPASQLADTVESAEPMRFGHFVVLKPLGRGGMGDVYLARDTQLDREVAVKTLRADVAALHPTVTERFLQEARSAAKLTHGNIVQVYFAGVEGETPYFAMEYVAGRSLRDYLEEEGPMPAEKALDCGLQAARGLRAAAERNIAHRDIKPANLILDARDTLKIADFGLAKNLDSDLELTKTGAMVGTPYYMSPEQGEGGSSSHKSDIYSLGATLYHMISGHPPFMGDTPARVMLQHATQPLPPDDKVKGALGGEVFRLLSKMMAKEPADRHADYDELIRDLELLLRVSQSGSDPCGQLVATRRQLSLLKMGAIAGGTLAAAAALVIGALWGSQKAKAREAPAPPLAPFSVASAAAAQEKPFELPAAPDELSKVLESKRIESLRFRETPLKDALRLIASKADLNVLFDPDNPKLQKTVTAELEDVSVSDALEAILRVNGLAAVPQGKIIQVLDREPAPAAASQAPVAAEARAPKLDYAKVPGGFLAKPDIVETLERMPPAIRRDGALANQFHKNLIRFEFGELATLCEEHSVPKPEMRAASLAMSIAESIAREQVKRLRAKRELGENIAVSVRGETYALVSLADNVAVFRAEGEAPGEPFEVAWRDLSPAVARDLFRQSVDESERSRLFLAFWCVAFGLEPSERTRGQDFERYSGNLLELFRDLAGAELEGLANAPGASPEQAPASAAAPGIPAGFLSKPGSLSLFKLLPAELSGNPEMSARLLGSIVHYDFAGTQRFMEETNYAFAGADGTLALAQPLLSLVVAEQHRSLDAAVVPGEGGRLVEVTVGGKRHALGGLSGLGSPDPVSLAFQPLDDPDGDPFEVAWRDLSPAVALDLFRQTMSVESRRDLLFLVYWATIFDLSLSDAEREAFGPKPDTLAERRAELKELLELQLTFQASASESE